MTIRDKHMAQKKKEIEKIEKQQAMLIKKIAAIPTARQNGRMSTFVGCPKCLPSQCRCGH